MASTSDPVPSLTAETTVLGTDNSSESWNDTVPESALVYEKISNHAEILLPFQSDDDLMLGGFQGRYQCVANIYTKNGDPIWMKVVPAVQESVVLDMPHLRNKWYAFHSEFEKTPPQTSHFPVEVVERFRSPEFKKGMELKWLQLNELQQDKLFVLLSTAIAIWRNVYYDDNHNGWVRRSGPPAADSVFRNLKYYVHKLPVPANSVLDYLRRGRTEAVMQKCVSSIVNGGLMHHRLDASWVAALISGMANGAGRTAVHKLLEGIATLVPGLEIAQGLSAVGVFHITSATSSDSLSISSSSLSSSSRSCCAPDAKRRKTDGEQHAQTDKRKSQHSKQSNKKVDKADVKRITPSHHRHYVDLSVITRDAVSGVGIFVFLVEIHSAGKTFEEATQKFQHEMISVLQAQSQVFGLFFSKVVVLLYSAKKDGNRKITITREQYRLLEGCRNLEYDTFCVPHFQKLIMDIFSCIIHSIENVDA